jgi:hypothetical protein
MVINCHQFEIEGAEFFAGHRGIMSSGKGKNKKIRKRVRRAVGKKKPRGFVEKIMGSYAKE